MFAALLLSNTADMLFVKECSIVFKKREACFILL